MTLLSFEHFGGDIIRRTTNGSLPFTVKFKFGCQAEITDLDFHLVVQEQISQLQISVDDPVRVQILNRSANLVDIALHFKLMKSLSSPKKFVEGLILAQFE